MGKFSIGLPLGPYTCLPWENDIEIQVRYVVLAASATLFNLMWHAHRGSPFRQAAKMPWPYQHASRAEVNGAKSPELKRALHLFNCAQRAHVSVNHTPHEELLALITALDHRKISWKICPAYFSLS